MSCLQSVHAWGHGLSTSMSQAHISFTRDGSGALEPPASTAGLPSCLEYRSMYAVNVCCGQPQAA